jgi:hypothetical protein
MMQNLSNRIQTQQTPIQKAIDHFWNGILDLTVETVIVYNQAKQEEKKYVQLRSKS